MAESTNLKQEVTTDTSGYSRGINKAKADLKSFETTTKSVMSSIGNAMGVSTDKIERIVQSIRGMGDKMSQSGSEATASLGKVLSSISAVEAGIAGIGIGALVSGFKALASEAENFKQTVAGANIEMSTAAYIDTYKQALHDFNGEIGKGAAEAQSKWSIFWKSLAANAKQYLMNGGMTFMGDVTNGSDVQQAGVDKYVQSLTTAAEKSKEAALLTKDIYRIQRQISDETVRASDLDAKIADAKKRAYDGELSTVEQAKALAEAKQAIIEKYQGENGIIALNQRWADDMKAVNDLAASTPAQIDAANQQQIKANNLVRQMSMELKELSERQKTINIALATEAAKRKEIADQEAKRASMQGAIPITYTFDTPAVESMTPVSIPVKPVLDEEATVKLGETLQYVINDSITSVSESLGTLMGDLLTGGDAWSNFTSSAISAFGDMAIAVGKMAIGIGTASLGIKEALALQPELAIAAGAALVALGAAVKAGMANISSGNYSASASVATSSYSTSSSSDLAQREVNVKVTGTLQANGNTLVAVLNNENNRLQHTT